MIFLELADLEPDIKLDNLDAILNDTSTILDKAEEFAIAEVTTYLNDLYDVAAIFPPSSLPSRNKHLVSIVVTITLWHLYKRLPKRKIPEIRTKEYEIAIEFLNSVNDGRVKMVLPKKLNDEGNDVTRVRWGSQPPRSH